MLLSFDILQYTRLRSNLLSLQFTTYFLLFWILYLWQLCLSSPEYHSILFLKYGIRLMLSYNCQLNSWEFYSCRTYTWTKNKDYPIPMRMIIIIMCPLYIQISLLILFVTPSGVYHHNDFVLVQPSMGSKQY